MRTFIAITACVAACVAGCSNSNQPVRPYGAQGARLGGSLALLGWNMAVSNLRWDGDFVLIVNASLCAQGEINEALLYATVAIDGTRAGVWTQR